jgi:hypothetical protein
MSPLVELLNAQRKTLQGRSALEADDLTRSVPGHRRNSSRARYRANERQEARKAGSPLESRLAVPGVSISGGPGIVGRIAEPGFLIANAIPGSVAKNPGNSVALSSISRAGNRGFGAACAGKSADNIVMPMTSPAIPSRAWSAIACPDEEDSFFQHRRCGEICGNTWQWKTQLPLRSGVHVRVNV